ncbi:endonuclease VII domain-containing protein [Streptomyces sp. NPDC004237]|uniref:endonuclease VII domain-containing protein n=1 Tax=Streptomyces sp. NPDC004237 TaxID=3154455 RepID=UPI0033AA0936
MTESVSFGRPFVLQRDRDISGVAACVGNKCDRPALVKGMCSGHYQRERRTGDARLSVPVGTIERPKAPPCSVDSCDKPAHGRGWCGMHYRRWRVHGDPLREPAAAREGCSWEDGCDRPHFAKGHCHSHYQTLFKGRAYKLKYTYGITEDGWQQLFEAQGKRCPVCLRDEPPGDSTWHVHHDHRCCSGSRSCGKCVVAILCGPCNVGMGGLGDDPERLERAAQLMRKAGA